MPEVVEPGAYDPDKVRRTTGKILAYCLWSTLKGNVNRIILKLKFPMSHHIISQDYTSLHEAFNEVKKYESGSKIPEDLLKEIEPNPIIFEPVTMEYEKRELNKYFIELFNMSSATLRIMKRTSQ
mgnify:CR=1 FL=1